MRTFGYEHTEINGERFAIITSDKMVINKPAANYDRFGNVNTTKEQVQAEQKRLKAYYQTVFPDKDVNVYNRYGNGFTVHINAK